MDKEPSEIVKLTERISKDPKSKLFVPLAEEYKKTGDVEMAVYVLTEGLKNNPGYVTARSILGRLLLDQGDLAGAQKELEEVVKVIPDNLLAQRKLGDICVLQNKPHEALKHYKTVLSLSPRDEEVVSIVSDIEAGHDVSAKLQQPKSKPIVTATVTPQVKPQVKSPVTPSVKQDAKQQPQGSPVQQAQPTPPRTPITEPAPPPEQPSALEPAEITLAPAPPAEVKNEEPEEIFMVEPLEKEKQEGEPRAADVELPADQKQPAAAEKPVRTEAVDTEMREEAQAARRENVAEEPSEKSDDFTTDTLAELYITQGFYEKAIDIYERMLTDKPNSRGLKDKLDRVKAMASASVVEAEKPTADIFAEPQVYSAQEEPTAERGKPEFFAGPGEKIPVAKTEVSQETGVDKGAEALAPSPEPKSTQVKTPYTDFEPREYMPPKAEAEPRETQAAAGEENPERMRVASKSATAIRKDTIDRLESWLKNIKKES